MARRKRLLVVLSYYHPYISGVSEYAKLLAEGLSADYDVTVLTGQHDPSLPVFERMHGVDVHRAPALLFLHKGYISPALARQYRALAAMSDVVNFHLPMLDVAWLARLTPRRVPVITTYQCDVQAIGGLVDRLAVAAVNHASRTCLRRSSRVVVLSRDYADGSEIVAAQPTHLVEGYAPIKDNGPGIAINRPINHEAPVIGFLGRFVAEKGIDVLIEAFAHVLAQRPDARLILAGDYKNVAGGSIYPQIEKRITGFGDRIELLGRIGDDELGAFYGQLDVFVLPSVNAYEAFGMVQVEAMFTGVPVVASDMRGVRVPVRLTGAGELAPPGDASALAAAILRCVDVRAGTSRQAIREAALGVFSNAAFVQRYAGMIEELAPETDESTR
ncbi:glycosyltransferase involved in cell wall biosynthesis [Luteibacter sp. Sphag1AF]|uniref:glycosyltransferase family 4 protein n=1 Tax=Luteibacter sp. Sphag1AF TaxID=2587031 RepID=UPI00161206BE|nr:glycosyltransferase family 4 protein [Luteibacter sp. Sphag1AF]MBB3225867.1 glycosyltransferase involved in cell wall biosynthesis [Luteibacter sp. Sphag1AF]